MGSYSKPLRRSVANRQIAGICSGIAEYFGWDPTLVRVICVLLSIPSGLIGIMLVYVILWVVIPVRDYY